MPVLDARDVAEKILEGELEMMKAAFGIEEQDHQQCLKNAFEILEQVVCRRERRGKIIVNFFLP